MRKGIGVMIIFLLCAGMLLAGEVPTVEELISKVNANQQRCLGYVQDFTARQVVTVTDNANGVSQTTTSGSKLSYKSPDKVRHDVYDEDSPALVIKIECFNGNKYYLQDYKGEIYTLDINTVRPLEKQQEDFVRLNTLPRYIDFKENKDKFLQYNNVSINTAQSNGSEHIYCLEVTPNLNAPGYNTPLLPTLSKEPIQTIFSKIRYWLDYSKGVRTKEEYYAQNQQLVMKIEYADYQELETAEGKGYFNRTTITTRYSPTVTQEEKTQLQDLQINTGVSDTLFTLQP